MLGGCSNKGEFDRGWGARGNVEVGGKVDRILMGKLKKKCHLEDISRCRDKFGNYFNKVRLFGHD
jgi:hypothetical protein